MTTPRPPALVMGVPIDDLTLDEALDEIAELVTIGRSTGRSHQVATVNVDFLVNAMTDPAVGTILRLADVCLADGQPIVWAARAFGMPVAERVAGADLVPRLIEASATTGHHVHVFGSSPEVAARAEVLLRARCPTARFSIDPGPLISDPTDVPDAVIDSITAVGADVLCVALGNPKQERFISAQSERLGVPVAIGIGGTLDLLVGRRRRAPAWMQRSGLEWIARAAQEPGRLGRRYAHDIRVFAPRFARELRAARGRRSGLGIRLGRDRDEVRAVLGGSSVAPETEWATAATAIATGSRLVIAVERFDGAHDGEVRDDAAAQLAGLARIARRHDASVVWPGRPSSVARRLAALGVPSELLRIDGE